MMQHIRTLAALLLLARAHWRWTDDVRWADLRRKAIRCRVTDTHPVCRCRRGGAICVLRRTGPWDCHIGSRTRARSVICISISLSLRENGVLTSPGGVPGQPRQSTAFSTALPKTVAVWLPSAAGSVLTSERRCWTPRNSTTTDDLHAVAWGTASSRRRLDGRLHQRHDPDFAGRRHLDAA